MEHEQSTEQIEKQGHFGEPSIPNPDDTASPPPKRQKKKPLRLVITTIALGVLFGIFGIIIYTQFYRRHDPASYSPPPTVSEISEYPEVYKQAQLPEYPNADITSAGQKEAKPEDGISILAYTYDDIPAVAAFYDVELKKLGWKPDESIASDTTSSVYFKTYLKGDFKYAITATKSSQATGTDISISYTKK